MVTSVRENLMEDFNDLKTDLTLVENLPHLNYKPQERKNMVYNYLKKDPELIKKIEKIYLLNKKIKDFEIYNKGYG